MQPVVRRLGFKAATHAGQGTVDEDVESSELLDNVFVETFDGSHIGYVELHAMGFVPVGPQFIGVLQIGVQRAGRGDHRRPGFRQSCRQTAAEQRTGTSRDERDFCFQGKLVQNAHEVLLLQQFQYRDIASISEEYVLQLDVEVRGFLCNLIKENELNRRSLTRVANSIAPSPGLRDRRRFGQPLHGETGGGEGQPQRSDAHAN